MHRFALLTGALLAGGAAFGQDSAKNDLQPASEIMFAGTYHVATGIFEPAMGGPSFFAAPGIIYNNTCPTPSFASFLNGSTLIDEGRVPSETSPVPNVGSVNSYFVDEFQIGYCTRDLTGVFAITASFWQNYDDCATLALAGAPTASFLLNGLPGSAATGTLACFFVTVDLTGFEFTMLGDADGAYTTGSNLDEGFGYGLSLSGQTGTTNSAVGGFIIAGDVTAPGDCANGISTYYNTPLAPAGTGLDNDNLYRRDGMGGQTSGCFFFGAPPIVHAGFHMRIRANDVNDCNGNGIDDTTDIAAGTSLDCNTNGDPDECDIAAGTSQDVNTNGIPDECETDCNGNGIPDNFDISSGFSQDCQPNGIPDECEGPDCNGNTVPDACDLTAGTSQDCNLNSIPDECDISGGTSLDVDSNGIPDECEPDCNGNTVPDAFDISSGTSQDCNGNSIPDECDISSGTSSDFNTNGVPDECESTGSTPYCFGDGSGINCRCGNNAAPGEGCQNSTGLGGILIKVGGTSVFGDDTTLAAYQLPGDAFGIVYMGSVQINGGFGRVLGDGIKCAGGSFKRFPLTNADSNGVLLQSNVVTLSGSLIDPGETWNFQCWYRDGAGPCSFGTNLTNAVAVTFTP